MKKMVFLLSLFLIAVMITSCAGRAARRELENATEPKAKTEKKSQADIEVFWDEKPTKPYKGIGRVSVSKIRAISPFPVSSDVCIENLKKQAAKKGGDGIINIMEDFASMSGTVIRFTEPDKAKPPAE